MISAINEHVRALGMLGHLKRQEWLQWFCARLASDKTVCSRHLRMHGCLDPSLAGHVVSRNVESQQEEEQGLDRATLSLAPVQRPRSLPTPITRAHR